LESLGYTILHRNWRCPFGEIDIVASRDAHLVFFEVKYRSSGTYGSGEEALTTGKMRRLRRLVQAYLQDNPSLRYRSCGVEVVAVIPAGSSLEFRITSAI